MSNMAFMSRLADFLKSNGRIYTVRKYRYSNGQVAIEDVGICKREFVKQVYLMMDLTPYLAESGFVTLSDWWKAIRTFVKLGPLYLYEVSK